MLESTGGGGWGQKKLTLISKCSGGEEVLLDVGGQDATEAFEDVGHSDEARETLEQLEGWRSEASGKHAHTHTHSLSLSLSFFLSSLSLAAVRPLATGNTGSSLWPISLSVKIPLSWSVQHLHAS